MKLFWLEMFLNCILTQHTYTGNGEDHVLFCNNPLGGRVLRYSTAQEFFFYPTHPSGADCFTHCNPTQTLPVILWHAITVGFKTLFLSTEVKQGKVHRSDSPHCNPIQSSSETLPVFSLQCFHRNGWTPSGVRNFNPFLSVLLPTGMGGKLEKKNKKKTQAVLYLACHFDFLATTMFLQFAMF